ncbi:hypothetical protein ACSBPU_15045 [Parapusillimonas sp. JC17]|uniref:hypothetical protein n=1 Tax=Parapusillimonas sp. JC17 TaxID=3445768 RepID=UPI002B39A03B|nr:hypothetical protein [Alcaligenaceae bacterium]
MKQDTHDREKQRAALEHNHRQAQARDDLQTTKDEDFYARLGLTGSEAEAGTADDAFVISIHCERWTLQDLEARGVSTHDIELDRVIVVADDLARHGRDYGISEPSCTDPSMAPDIWFRSTYPRQDRAYFEQGVQKYYSLHIHEVNGHPPSPIEYQRVADLVGVRFDQAVLRQEQGLEQEGPDLCL